MENNEKPTFGVTVGVDSASVDLARKQRPEIGAIWERSSKNGVNYLNIKLKLPRELLLDMLNNYVDEIIPINLVAFINKNKDDNPKRPTFRIYQEIPKNTQQ